MDEVWQFYPYIRKATAKTAYVASSIAPSNQFDLPSTATVFAMSTARKADVVSSSPNSNDRGTPMAQDTTTIKGAMKTAI